MKTSMKLLAGKHVLIVEDEYLVAAEARRALEKAGAVVVGPAPSVEEGIRLLEVSQVDGAILDIRLDGETVFPIADRLIELNIPFVFATAYTQTELPGRYGGYVLCEKPAELDVIASALFANHHKDH
ncbi:response regulator [Oryzifoliimicrobium ureilyticus]|uniref:response regulator n=1 Tax=Oryzifoliimicrobium ureilyticus TaxID=3113724 RepID=UPI0030764315